LVWSGSKFYFIGLATPSTTSTCVYSSSDGLTWSLTAFPGDGDVTWRLAYGSSGLVAISSSKYSSIRAYQSSDGVVWTPAYIDAVNWGGIAFGNGVYVAVADYNDIGAATSSDGTSWTPATLTKANRSSVCFGDGKFFSPRIDSNKGDISTDGTSWEEVTLPASRQWVDCYYTGELFICVARREAYEGEGSFIAYSEDAENWSETLLPAFSVPDGAFFNNSYVTCAGNSNIIVVLNDGTNEAGTIPGYIGNEYAYSTNGSVSYTMGNIGFVSPFETE
jgi:hypothetical protein